MGTWPFWALFLTLGSSMFLAVRRLDDRERSRAVRDRIHEEKAAEGRTRDGV